MTRPGAPKEELSRRAFTVLEAVAHLEPAAARDAARASCAGDAALLAEVASLLAAEERCATPVDHPVFPGLGQRLAEVFESAKVEEPMPARLGPYRIEGELGRGGSAVVLRAVQDGPGRAVALKILVRLPARDAMRRFRAEVAALARLSHPGIAAIYDAGTHDFPWGASPWIAMELVPGKPITTYARESGLNWRQAVSLAADACGAVAHAHLRGIMHLDLKPANVLVLPPEAGGEAPRVKVLDFGLARFTSREVEDSVSLAGPLGTIAYASPEQLRGAGPDGVDARADVYALGILLHELVRGEPAFDPRRDGTAGVVAAIVKGRVPPLRRPDGRAAPPELAAVAARATALDPEDRYKSVADFAEDLGRVLRGEPIAARRLGPVYRARCLARSRPATAAGVLVGVLGVAGVVGGTTFGMVRARAAERRYLDQRNALIHWTETHGTLADLRSDDYRFDEAREARESIARLLHGMSARAPRDLDLAAAHSIAIVKIGDLEMAQNRLDAAHERYAEALAIDQRLRAERPGDERLADSVVRGHTRLAWVCQKRADLRGAAAWADRAVAGAQDLRRRAPDSPLSTHACIEALLARSGVARDAGDLALASSCARAAWDLAGELRRRWPLTAHLAEIHGRALRMLREHGGASEAHWLAHAHAALPVLGEATRREPGHIGLAWQVCALHEELAARHAARGDPQRRRASVLDMGRAALRLWQARSPEAAGRPRRPAGGALVRVAEVMSVPIRVLGDPAFRGDPDCDLVFAMLVARFPMATPEQLADAASRARHAAETADSACPDAWLIAGECLLAAGDARGAGAAIARAEAIPAPPGEFCLSVDELRRLLGSAEADQPREHRAPPS